MADDVPPNVGPTWMTYPELADRLGLLTPAAAAARARRAKWPKRLRNDTGQAEVEVPAEALSAARKRPLDARSTRRPSDTPDVAGDAVRAAVAPLQAALERQEHENKLLQVEVKALQDRLRDAQVEAGQGALAREELNRERGDRIILQGQADALRDQLASVQLEAAQATGAANTERAKREAAEAKAQDLQAQLDKLQARPRRRWWIW